MGSVNAEKTDSLKAIELSQLQKTVAPSPWESQIARPRIRRALEPQTALSEILPVSASSPTDIQPVLDPETDGLAQTFRQSTNRTCEMITCTSKNYVGQAQR